MQVKCPNCGFAGNIADKLVPDEGRNVGCPKCKERFFVEKKSEPTSTPELENENNLDKLIEQEWKDFYGSIDRLAPKDWKTVIKAIVFDSLKDNENPQATVRKIREQILGLKSGERNKDITNLSNLLFITESKKFHSSLEKNKVGALTIGPKTLGIQIRNYGPSQYGACPYDICGKVLGKGSNFRRETGELVADFWLSESAVYWPPHCPHCTCSISMPLSLYAWEEELVRRGLKKKEPAESNDEDSDLVGIRVKYRIIDENNRQLESKRAITETKQTDLASSIPHNTCPKCGSTDITWDKQGFGNKKATCGCCLLGPLGILLGLFGKDKPMQFCQKCGYRWK
jgi:predicted Zn finger-like uncharacterized protein